MKFMDMLQMSANSLWKRKLRTLLTILGVVIGVASIVVMVSLGIGMSRSIMNEYQSYGSMTQISVQESYSSSTSTTATHLDDTVISQLEALEHVTSVYPVLEYSAYAIYGGYNAYLTIEAMPLEALEAENISVGQGQLPNEEQQDLEFFYGFEVLQQFNNTKTGKGYWETGVLPDIDLMNTSLFYVFDTTSYTASQTTGANVTQPKKTIVPTCGVEETPASGYSSHGWYVYCELDKFEAVLKKIFKNNAIPGQPLRKGGKPYTNKIFYTKLLVNADDMDNVSAITEQISDMGFQAYSDAEWISSAQQSLKYSQAVLGGIGAVSLLVAAIGIANTMMMSIYERTKEIGVMKVLGCDLKDIRMLFLMEAAMIGLVGGVFGVGISYGIGAIINFVSSGSDSSGLTNMLGVSSEYGSICYTPVWLSLLAVVFAIIIAMVAGFFPAQKAMKLSPLAAIRNE